MTLSTRVFLRLLAATTATVALAAQTPPARPASVQNSTDVVVQVRNALGHGKVAEARRLADTSSAPAASKGLASAMVDIFEGKDEEARTKLTPLATAAPQGDSALELGLLYLRHGRRDEGRQILNGITDSLYGRATQNAVLNDNDYFRL